MTKTSDILYILHMVNSAVLCFALTSSACALVSLSEWVTVVGATVSTSQPLTLLPGNCCIQVWGCFFLILEGIVLKHQNQIRSRDDTTWSCQSKITCWKAGGKKSLPVPLVMLVPWDLKTMLGVRTNPAISKKETKLSTTRNLRNRKNDRTPPPKFPVGEQVPWFSQYADYSNAVCYQTSYVS